MIKAYRKYRRNKIDGPVIVGSEDEDISCEPFTKFVLGTTAWNYARSMMESSYTQKVKKGDDEKILQSALFKFTTSAILPNYKRDESMEWKGVSHFFAT